MAKPKSLKLRTLVTLRALWKYSDANHRMNTVKINEYLRPYGLACTKRVLGDTANVLREMGMDVRNKGEWERQGIWIDDRPLPDHELKRLIFAVSTNPHLSKEQTTEILQSLKPFVTVYQEPLLYSLVETEPTIEVDDTLCWAYTVIQEAISAKRRVMYSIDYAKYNKENQTVIPCRQWETLFTPKCIYQTKNNLFMVGYNSNDRKVDAVNLKDIASIRLAFKHKGPKAVDIARKLEAAIPQHIVPGENEELIYEGPIVFRCKGLRYLTELYRRFGPPSGPVERTVRGLVVYPTLRSRVTSETLFWLSQVPGHGVRILGPEPLAKAVKGYFADTAETLLSPVFRQSNKSKNQDNDA